VKRAMLLAFLLAGCAGAPSPAPVAAVSAPPSRTVALPSQLAPEGPFALKNPSLEMDPREGAACATSWFCTMHKDPKSFRFFADDAQAPDGKRGLCIEPSGKEPWALVTQGILDRSLNGARVRFTLAVRLDNVAGQGAGSWVRVQRGGGANPVSQNLAKDTPGWQDQSVEVEVPDDAVNVEVGATLRGTGRACFDNARLEVLRAGKKPV